MQCSSCGAHLAPGATTCPVCGRPTPYNVPGSSASNPTVVAPASSPQPPPTAYGSFSSGPASPYGASLYATPPSAPYPVSPSNAQQYPYGPPYATPSSVPYPAPPVSPFNAQQQNSGLSTPFPPAPMPGSFSPPPPQGKRRGRFIALIVGVVGLILVLSIVGILLVPRLVGSLGPRPTIGPSGSPVTTGLLSNVQQGSAADSNCQITQPGSTITVGQTLYIAFDLHLNGQTGYITVKFYQGQEFLVQTNVLAVQPGVLRACAYASFPIAIPNGIAELYWCQQSDCSDGKLAAVTNFVVTAASSNLAAPGQAVTVALLTERSRMPGF